MYFFLKIKNIEGTDLIHKSGYFAHEKFILFRAFIFQSRREHSAILMTR